MPSAKKVVSAKAEPYDQPSSLMLKTITLVKERGMLQVYTETGIPFYWLKRFVTMGFQNPSVNRVQYLFEHLTSTELLK